MADDIRACRQVRLTNHDPGWPLEFARERDRLLAVLGDDAIAIEHIGSTAVPGLRAKPVIDIMIGVKDLAHADRWVEPLARLGYRCLAEYEIEAPGRRLFRRGPFGASTHHLHVYRTDHPDWTHLLHLRSYFRAHPEAARDYARLKQDLVRRYPGDSVAYTEGKRSFLEEIRRAAAAELGPPPDPAPPAILRRRLRRAVGRTRRGLLRVARVARVGGWPRVTSSGRDIEPRVAAAATTLTRILVEAVVPFWRERVIDREAGGYHLHHGPTGEDLGPAPRHVVGQARTLWFFARLARSPFGRPSDLAAAHHGFRFLADRLWDPHHGGFAWQVLADGEPLQPHKHALAQTFSLLALTEYWRATRDPAAIALAQDTFTRWDGHAHDEAHGGYVEMHRHDWSSAADLTGYWDHDPAARRLDTHLHIADALATLHRVAPAPLLAARLAELLRIVTTADADAVAGVAAFTPDWIRQPTRRIEYGFDVKRIRLTAQVGVPIGVDPVDHLDLFRRLFANAMRWGWDRRDGGLFEAGLPSRRAHELVKSWWTQAELLAASLTMWRLSGQRAYAEVFLRTLDWVARWQVDWVHGDCHETVDCRRRPRGRKAWAWKGPYHVTHAIFDCLALLERQVYSEPA